LKPGKQINIVDFLNPKPPKEKKPRSNQLYSVKPLNTQIPGTLEMGSG
jgi:hypothetical protein